MLKNKSPEDINRVGNEGLFNELTSEEGAVIVGGAELKLINAVVTSGTLTGTYSVEVNGTELWKEKLNNATFVDFMSIPAHQFDGFATMSVYEHSDRPCGDSGKKLLGSLFRYADPDYDLFTAGNIKISYAIGAD